MKLLFILSLVFLFINISLGQSNDCSSSLSKYFTNNMSSVKVQLVVIRPSGDVVYANNTLSNNFGVLTNGNSFPAVFSSKISCTNGKVQLFDVAQQKVSFNDRAGILLYSDGRLNLTPTWGSSWKLNLTCTGTGSGAINYGWTTDGNLITLQIIE
ncbi:hypothetical protein DICPUDRAFT_74818 [Dictyostelium purpureum]|uniref:Uncharacterized protein n=1 Tax=Dictyostelium purpureum TaxID=5786 RepID=F0Z8U1_DICPU|nr:uncharacterized protein DICPUDRAFT_74818 [Dictyostelium purpureum]EGC39634.1 hypothetical protein DICPUDRAFT_74818 [Dictyostelium purpureum]|eukprot:XP_003283855.1 hypothetical protein DICPUDRAFT_74818 [Dictyostelium purpureum]